MEKIKAYLPLALRIIVALILINTLRFKFTGHEDSLYIFKTINMEPVGRIAIGIVELIAAILLLIPKTVWLGALMTISVLGGAVYFHLTKLGIEVNGDGGVLFYTAIGTLLLSTWIVYLHKDQIPG